MSRNTRLLQRLLFATLDYSDILPANDSHRPSIRYPHVAATGALRLQQFIPNPQRQSLLMERSVSALAAQRALEGSAQAAIPPAEGRGQSTAGDPQGAARSGQPQRGSRGSAATHRKVFEVSEGSK